MNATATSHLSRSGQVSITMKFHNANKMWSVIADRVDTGERVANKFAMTEDDAKTIANEFWKTDGVQASSLVDLAAEFTNPAETMARATGSVAARYTEETVALNGTRTVTHESWFDRTNQTAAPLATDSQLSYLRNLLTEREVPTAQIAQVEEALGGSLTKRQASTWIDALLQHPKTARPQARQATTTDTPDVPAGHYATESRTGNNDLDFWTVDRPTQGRWTGYTFVKRVIGGHEDQSVRGAEARQALEAILAAGPEVASRRYGQEIGRCGRCNRHLTDEDSRAYGLGPDCRSKGW